MIPFRLQQMRADQKFLISVNLGHQKLSPVYQIFEIAFQGLRIRVCQANQGQCMGPLGQIHLTDLRVPNNLLKNLFISFRESQVPSFRQHPEIYNP